MEDQRKRTLDALERRFAQAEAEIRTQDQHSKKRKVEDKGKFAPKTESSSASAHSAVKKPISTAPSRKGNISFTGRTSRQDEEINQPAYLKLLHPVLDNLLQSGAEITDRKFVVDSLLHKLFEHGDSARKYMQGSKSMKIESTILLDNYVPRSSISVACSQALGFSKRSKTRMSLKQHKRIGSLDLPQEFHETLAS